MRKIMAGGVVAGQYAHMELLLEEEEKERTRREAEEMSKAAAEGVAMVGDKGELLPPEATKQASESVLVVMVAVVYVGGFRVFC